jgi:hypothetical protein
MIVNNDVLFDVVIVFVDIISSLIKRKTITTLAVRLVLYSKDSDRSRRKADFKVGQYVLLDTEHLKRHRPSRKLDFKRIGH